MALTRIVCPECSAGLKSQSGFEVGETVCCPKCETYFSVEEPEAVEEEELPKKKASGAEASPKKKAVAAAVSDEDDDEDEKPQPKKKKAVHATVSDDDDEDDEDDEKPRSKKKKKKKRSDDDEDERSYKNSPLRYAVLGVLVVTMLVLGVFLIRKQMKEHADNAGDTATGNTEGDKPSGGSGSGRPQLSGSQTTTPITLKLREDQVGDKTSVAEASNITVVSSAQGKGTEIKLGGQHDFTETILERPAGAERTTKFKREYRKAEDPLNAHRSSSYAGKTVLFELKDGHYAITVDGKPLPDEEEKALSKELEQESLIKYSDLLPQKPVKVGDSWKIDDSVVEKMGKAMMKEMPLPIEKIKGTATARMVQAYNIAGKQWAVIEFKIDFTIEGNAVSGTISETIHFDGVVDGSSHEGTMKSQEKAVLNTQVMGNTATITVSADNMKSAKPVK